MKVTKDSCGGDDRWPPGFRFHPTDEELVVYYLKRKMCRRRIKLDIIAETDVYKWDPEELPGQSVLKTGDRQWFFFSPRDRKYPNGARSNRATRHGYWKATGKDRNVTCNSRTVGLKKTLVFYRGRAPNGERTDWVMHEYTLDEEELKRCQNVKDYYALYKVYKKSGPGPKNGEQYGAPFKEEEWADDEFQDVHDTVDSEIPPKQIFDVNDAVDSDITAKQLIDVTPVDNELVNGQAWSPLVDMEEFMRRISDEDLLPLQQVNEFTDLIPQVVGEEDTQSTLLEPSFGNVIFPEPVSVLPPSGLQYDEQAGFDFTQSATSKPQACDVEVTSAINNGVRVPRASEDDFLEIDDLDYETTSSNIEKPVENFQQFKEFVEYSELDVFHDAALFLQDMGPVDQGTVSHSYVNTIGNGMVNQVDYHLQSHSVVNQVDYQWQPHAVVNQLDYQLQPYAVVNQLDYQLQPPAVGADQMNSQPLTHEQIGNVFTPSASNQGAVSLPASGVVYESTNLPTEANQNQNQNGEEGAGTSRFSSVLWSFVESIPTTPASASERPLVNRAFERMSSFSRVRLNVRSNNVAAGNDYATVRRAGSNRGFLFWSIIGILLAILWVLIGSGSLGGMHLMNMNI